MGAGSHGVLEFVRGGCWIEIGGSGGGGGAEEGCRLVRRAMLSVVVFERRLGVAVCVGGVGVRTFCMGWPVVPLKKRPPEVESVVLPYERSDLLSRANGGGGAERFVVCDVSVNIVCVVGHRVTLLGVYTW